jgi:hypothetical protein
VSVRSWIEMPVSDDASLGGTVRPRHAIEGNALLVYRGDKVYAALNERGVADRIAELPDVRRLSQEEAGTLEATLPGRDAFASYPGYPRPDRDVVVDWPGRVGLGDVVGWLARALGMRECGTCNQRREALNRVKLWHSHRR